MTQIKRKHGKREQVMCCEFNTWLAKKHLNKLKSSRLTQRLHLTVKCVKKIRNKGTRQALPQMFFTAPENSTITISTTVGQIAACGIYF